MSEYSERQYRVASTLGPRYMVPSTFSLLDEAETFMRNHKRILGELSGSDTVRIETRVISATDWEAL